MMKKGKTLALAIGGRLQGKNRREETNACVHCMDRQKEYIRRNERERQKTG